MPKITIGVYKSYRNSGYRNHRQKTKKHWCHYFIEYDEYDPEERQFGTEWISSLKAMMLKRHVWKKKRFHCLECDTIWAGYVPAKQTEIECPRCDE